MGKTHFITDETEYSMNINDFRINSTQGKFYLYLFNLTLIYLIDNYLHLFEYTVSFFLACAAMQRPWLGLDHVNKAPKRPRINYLEKAIKIYN